MVNGITNNTTIQRPTVAGDNISTEDLGGVKLPRSKIVLGDYGVDSGDVAVDNPLPVDVGVVSITYHNGSSSDPLPVNVVAPPTPVTVTSFNVFAQSSNNTSAIIAYSSAVGVTRIIGGVAWSYAGTGTLTGVLEIADESNNVVFNVDITSLGPGFIPFNPPITTGIGHGITVTLGAGGSAILGKVNVLSSWSISPP